MQGRFGQTLFAGVATGFIVASGVASATAAASGQHETTRFFQSEAHASATVEGAGLRATYAAIATATATGNASGNARGTYSKSGLAQALAAVSGSSRVDFCGYGEAEVVCTVDGFPYRLARAWPFSARALAEGEADGVTYQYGQASPARAFAGAFGTTYQVGHGQAIATVAVQGTVYKQAGMAGAALAVTNAQNTEFLRVAGAQADSIASASVYADAAVTREGVRQFECTGEAIATCVASTPNGLIFQQQNAQAVASIYGTCMATFGAIGHGYGIAVGLGDGIGATTGVTGGGSSQAQASGRPQVECMGYGNAQPKALVSMALDAKVTQTRSSGQANAAAVMRGVGVRNCLAEGAAQAKALPTAFPVKSTATSSSTRATATATSSGVRIDVVGSAIAYGGAYQELEAVRVVYGQGLATLTATAVGHNQVNDLVRAPFVRTLYPLIEDRVLTMTAEARTIAV